MNRKYCKPTAKVVKLDLGDEILSSEMLTGSTYDKNGNYNGQIPSCGDLPTETPWGAKKHGDWGYGAWDDDDDNANN